MKLLPKLKKLLFRIASVVRSSREYQLSISYTVNSGKKLIFKTRNQIWFKVYYFFAKKYYKRKMFLWFRILELRTT